MVLWKGIDVTLTGSVIIDASKNIVVSGAGQILLNINPLDYQNIVINGNGSLSDTQICYEESPGVSTCTPGGYSIPSPPANIKIGWHPYGIPGEVTPQAEFDNGLSVYRPTLLLFPLSNKPIINIIGPSDYILTNLILTPLGGGNPPSTNSYMPLLIGGAVVVGGLLLFAATRKKKSRSRVGA